MRMHVRPPTGRRVENLVVRLKNLESVVRVKNLESVRKTQEPVSVVRLKNRSVLNLVVRLKNLESVDILKSGGEMARERSTWVPSALM
jgi:hypothetical protein